MFSVVSLPEITALACILREWRHNLSQILQQGTHRRPSAADFCVYFLFSYPVSLYEALEKQTGQGQGCSMSYLRSIRCISMTIQARAQRMGERTDNRLILRARHSAPRVSNVIVEKHTNTRKPLLHVRGVICKLMQRWVHSWTISDLNPDIIVFFFYLKLATKFFNR